MNKESVCDSAYQNIQDQWKPIVHNIVKQLETIDGLITEQLEKLEAEPGENTKSKISFFTQTRHKVSQPYVNVQSNFGTKTFRSTNTILLWIILLITILERWAKKWWFVDFLRWLYYRLRIYFKKCKLTYDTFIKIYHTVLAMIDHPDISKVGFPFQADQVPLGAHYLLKN